MVPCALEIALELSKKGWENVPATEKILTKRVEKVSHAYEKAKIPIKEITIKPQSLNV